MYKKIKKLCKKNGISIKILEQKLGFSQGSLYKVDKNKPNFTKVVKIAKYFDVPIEYFADE